MTVRKRRANKRTHGTGTEGAQPSTEKHRDESAAQNQPSSQDELDLDELEMAAGGILAVPKALARFYNDPRAFTRMMDEPMLIHALRAEACNEVRGFTHGLSKLALKQAFLQSAGTEKVGQWDPPYDAYAADVEANLLDGVPFVDIRQAFDDGKGQELRGEATHPPKMAAIYSSSALVVNTFGPWFHDPRQLVINSRQGFTRMRFEAQVPTGLGGTPPHLDLQLDASDRILGIESKCLEYLSLKEATFSPAYDTITDHRAQSSWYRHIAVLRKDSSLYQYLDAAQLIKHALGLAHTFPNTPLTLLYLYWEPRNWQDFEPFWQHHTEIRQFREVVAGDPVRFEALSYNDLWAQWEPLTQPAWISAHLQRLTVRYQIELQHPLADLSIHVQPTPTDGGTRP